MAVKLNYEPAVLATFAAALIGDLAIVGISVSEPTKATITGVITLLAGFFIRSKVTPVAKANDQVQTPAPPTG